MMQLLGRIDPACFQGIWAFGSRSNLLHKPDRLADSFDCRFLKVEHLIASVVVGFSEQQGEKCVPF